jgi:hypothetical protein
MWSHPKSAKVQMGGTITRRGSHASRTPSEKVKSRPSFHGVTTITALKIQVVSFSGRKMKIQKVVYVPGSVKGMKEPMTQRAQSEKEQLSHEICAGLAALFCLMVL